MSPSVHRIPDPGLGNSAWLVDLGDGSALVVDPSRDPRGPLEAAEKRGLTIRWVAETHVHADFVSGARELAAGWADVTHLAPAGAGLVYDHRAVADGEEHDLAGLSLTALHTPGHTPEHVAWVLRDGGRPTALFSGGTLMVGGVARPDLISPEQTEPLARAAWRSITDRLLVLPDELPVYPTHGGGSFCSAAAGGEPSTTIGEQAAANPLLQADGEDDFVRRLLEDLGTYPPYFLRLRDVNRRGPRLYGTATPTLPPLSPGGVTAQLRDGARVIDVRPIDRYAAGHVPGSLSIELRDSLATWLGWLVDDPATPLVFVIDDDQDHDDLVRQCLKVGFEQFAGRLAGGVAAWEGAGMDLATTELTDEARPDTTLVDVRQRAEWDEDHVAGAVHVELGSLAAAADELPRGRLTTHCMHGQRSMTAASVLEAEGRDDVVVFAGGPQDWRDRDPAA